MKDQSDVGPLSCRVTFKPVSAPLQGDISLLPTSQARTRHRRTLRSRCPARRAGAIRGFHVPLREVRRVRCLLSTGRPWTTRTQSSTFLPPPTPFLVQASQPLSLVYTYDLYHRFRYLHPTGYLALTQLRLPGGHASRDLYPAQTVLRYIVRAALDSCP